MNIFIYTFIFVSKIIENAVGTLRLILVSNGKKVLGAILQLIIALVWVLSTGLVVVNINKDPLKILFFCLGSLVGSYLGSIIEEKLALGSNLLVCIADKKYNITDYIRSKGYAVTSIDGKGKDSSKNILFIMIKRKEISKIVRMLKSKDKNLMIVAENAVPLSGGYTEN